MYRAGREESLRPVGETGFVQGIAAQSASGGYGAKRANAGIVGHADLMLGAAVEEVLEAHLAASPNRSGASGTPRPGIRAIRSGAPPPPRPRTC